MKRGIAYFSKLAIVAFSLAFFGVSPANSGGADLASQKGQVSQVSVPSSGSPETLRVYASKSLVLNTGEPIKRVSVTNEEVVTAIIITPMQLLIHGLKPGIVTLILWNEQEQMRSFDLQVQSIPMNLEPLRANIRRSLPGLDIDVHQSGSSLVLTGTVPSETIAEHAGELAKTETEKVVNLLEIPPIKDTVLLEVKFAEVQRSAVTQLGINLFSTGALNTIGVTSTQQFPAPTASDVSSAIGAPLSGFSTELELTDLLNIFVFRPDLNLGVAIRALKQKNLLETLAEPNLLALGGKEASFLAGGEFPVPIVHGTSGNQSVSISFKEFGVRLGFLAIPNPDGTISLKVEPEVSALDYANAVTLAGFLIPALSTRKAQTEVELKDGQSFAIAGLMDNRITKVSSKVPWLGDVPVLGKLFQSTSFQKGDTELLVVVTPHIVKPLDPGQKSPMPSFPVPFLNQKDSQGKTGEGALSPSGDQG